jgi:hypothetical protein
MGRRKDLRFYIQRNCYVPSGYFIIFHPSPLLFSIQCANGGNMSGNSPPENVVILLAPNFVVYCGFAD